MNKYNTIATLEPLVPEYSPPPQVEKKSYFEKKKKIKEIEHKN